MRDWRFTSAAALAVWLGLFTSATWAQQRVPHNQDKPPGPALSPEEAIQKMTVPPGFKVEIVAAEPQIVNPVAMTFDERGRVWVTESLEYPRASAGPGKDRVKILEDTDGDGRMDKVSVFAEGLNIPSGIAVGYGGVWVANSPDIIFMQDTDGDGKADKQEVVITGFGRTDTHELPNSLTWGPDGWLYGLNGVFNYSHVYYSKTNTNYKADHPGWKFTCAMFRIHPRTREFQIFAEGTSNPWGIAFDNEGSAFVSACVIDHLWHIVETGYYHRQGGPYPPFTWKIESIVKHKHQKAAYCGLHYFDSDAYPAQYREKLYMGNIHGNCINVDKLQRDGSTYFATGEPDFLSANDAWFMPVAQKTGPDGCLYVLDWYDQYHCYQDARRDPNGIEQAKGRLYRVRYTGETKVATGERRSVSATSAAATKDVPNATRIYPQFDLAKETDDQLIERLGSPNVYFRDIAQRLLSERNNPETVGKFRAIVLNKDLPRKLRFHSLFAWAGMSTEHGIRRLLAEIPGLPDSEVTAFVTRAWFNDRVVREEAEKRLRRSLDEGESLFLPESEGHLDVQLQWVIGISKLNDNKVVVRGLLDWLVHCGDDKLIPHVVWQNLHPRLETHAAEFLDEIAKHDHLKSDAVRRLTPRVCDRLLGRKEFDASLIVRLFDLVRDRAPNEARECLALLASRIQTGELKGKQLAELKVPMEKRLRPVMTSARTHPVSREAILLAASWKDSQAIGSARQIFETASVEPDLRLRALSALVAAGDSQILDAAQRVLQTDNQTGRAADFASQMLIAIGRLDNPRVAEIVLTAYPQLQPDVQPKAIELLTQRAAWAKKLLAAIDKKMIPAEALNLNQLRKLNATKDPDIVKSVQAQWGIVREGRNPQRELIIADMRRLIRANPGDAHRGEEVFKKVCGQCHKMYGEGQEVGPDITLNGRNSYDQLLSNVFDPSLVIGVSYQARTILTKQGRVVSGLVAEESDQRVVLKVQGGKQEVIPRGDIDEMKTSELSLMPEDVEKTLKPQEIADLFAYITLDKPPSDPTAKRLPGVYDESERARKK